MPFAIMLRRLGDDPDTTPTPLAVDIPNPTLARGIVERIASTYPGSRRTRAGRSFRNGDGLHEIWAEPQRG